MGANWLDKQFAAVLTQPRARARETARLAGYGGVAQIDDNLQEWDYGIYEGITTADIPKVYAGLVDLGMAPFPEARPPSSRGPGGPGDCAGDGNPGRK